MSSPFPRLAALVAVAAGAIVACAEPELPPYTRLDGGPAPVVGAGPVLVVFWASWCPPCREELPGLGALARDPPAGLRVVTLGQDQDEAPVRELFGGAPPAELGYRRDVARVAEGLGVKVLPAAFLAVDGRLVARFSGPRDWSSRGMRRLLTRLASEAPPSGPVRSPPGVDSREGPR